jgi:hypothetical protein
MPKVEEYQFSFHLNLTNMPGNCESVAQLIRVTTRNESPVYKNLLILFRHRHSDRLAEIGNLIVKIVPHRQTQLVRAGRQLHVDL